MQFEDYNELFGTGSRKEIKEKRDIMQICLNGHVINEYFREFPQFNKDYCVQCGEKTITKCPACNKEIPGALPDEAFAMEAPTFCEKCGKPFPWNNKKPSNKNELRPIEILKRIFFRFHIIVKQIRNRYNDRPTIDIADEYDVQDFLKSLLLIFFDDIRDEEWTPSYAGKSARMDFLLKNEEIVIETKMTRKGLTGKEVGDQLLIDIDRYKEHPNCKTLVCFIYDPEGRISNVKGLINDLQKKSTDRLKIFVFVNPM